MNDEIKPKIGMRYFTLSLINKEYTKVSLSWIKSYKN